MGSEAIATEGSRKGDFLGGKYLLEDCLGIGGMGEVYRATNVSLDRKVAIKLLSADFAKNEDDVLRFLREARAAAAVRHPNVVDVIDVAREEDGTPFIVQELLSGEDLEQYLHNAGGRLAPEEILEILIPVADAIAAAHAKQVIHRDLKPANIFLAREGHRVTPKVLDFGACLYKTVGGLSSKEQRMLIGTPHYMAPEQVIADKELDARADVWALGVIAYELLVGETPFEADNVNEVLKLVRTKRIPPLSVVARDTPEPLQNVVVRCLSRARAERYADGAALHDALVDARDAIRGPIQELPPQSRRRFDSRAEIENTSEVRTKMPAEPLPMPAESAFPSLLLGPRPAAKKGPTKRRGSALLTLSMPDEGVGSDPPSASARGGELDLTLPNSNAPTSVERPVAREWPLPPSSSPLGLDSDHSLAALDLDMAPKMPSSIPPVLNPRAATTAYTSPMPMPSSAPPPALARTSGVDFEALEPIGLGAPPSHRGASPRTPSQATMPALAGRASHPSIDGRDLVRTSQTGLTPSITQATRRVTTVAPAQSASLADTLVTTGIALGAGLAGFVALSFVQAITVPIGRALRGESIIGCGLLTIVVLVSAVVLAVRLVAQRSRSLFVATIGAGIFGILMIAVTFGASEAAELGIPSAAAALVPFIAPIAPFALVVNLVATAREDWGYERGTAIRSIVLAAILVVVGLGSSPVGATRTPAPRTPSSTAP